MSFPRDLQFYRFAAYGFLKNLRFFEPFLILFFRRQHLSFLEIGVLFSIRAISTNILEIPSGLLADLRGRKLCMVVSMLAYILSFLIFYLGAGFYLFALAMIFFAGGEAFRTGTHKALILSYLRRMGLLDLRVDYYGSTRAASQLGSALNSLLAAGLVFWRGDYRVVFLAALLPYFINLINLATYPAYLDEGIGERKGRETFREFLSIFRSSAARRALLNSAVFDAFFKAGKEYLQPVLKSLALSLPLFFALAAPRRVALLVGGVYFLIYLATSWASRNAGRLSRGFGDSGRALNLTFPVGAALLAGSGGFIMAGRPALAVVLFLLLFVLQNARRPVNVAYLSEKISHRTMASGLSAESQIKTLLIAVLAPAAGFLADSWGVGGMLVIAGVVMGILLPWVYLRKNQGGYSGNPKFQAPNNK